MVAKKKSEVDLSNIFTQYTDDKKIDKATLRSVLEESFRSVIVKAVGSDENYEVIINPDRGDCEIYRTRNIVADGAVSDPNNEIAISDARKLDDEANVGETYTETVSFEEFGRRSVLNLRQTLASKILELQKDSLSKKYKEKIGRLVNPEVYQVWKREMLLVDEENNEMTLPKGNMIPTDFYRKGENCLAVVDRVDDRNNDPKIILSRTSEIFLQRLFEREVPEINDGLITIKRIARIPGERAKVAVESYDERIDPVGACVGMKGNRIHGIVRELRNENIDVIPFTDNVKLLIARSLSPAKIDDVSVYEEHKRADVFLQPDEVSLAIGKGGMNIKLASMLTGYQIEVFRNADANTGVVEDVYLDDFLDEIDPWVIETLKKMGLDTAKQVLAVPREDLINKSDLEEETIDDVLRILTAEFDPNAAAAAAAAVTDLDLDDALSEVDSWVVDALKNMGCKTASQVLALPREEIIDKADLEEETVDEVLRILSEKMEQLKAAEPVAEPAAEVETEAATEPEAEPTPTEQNENQSGEPAE